MIIAFIIKLPIYGIHLWLPKAHVEAPAPGSIILAAVMLKLGGYGMYRIIPPAGGFLLHNTEILFGIFLVGAALTAVICLAQVDQKALVAYSSVCHMGIMVLGVLGLSSLCARGFLVVALAHGFCSSALFFLINVSYERLSRRELLLIRGLGRANVFLLVG